MRGKTTEISSKEQESNFKAGLTNLLRSIHNLIKEKTLLKRNQTAIMKILNLLRKHKCKNFENDFLH